ncbi:MAG TPA: MGMT family protein [Blastocatellia bacterium]|jgi:methylated-DNA-protein-cysteine methyltransferase-like protein|nr:MGMT family protein [Blastocatellia bacterium]
MARTLQVAKSPRKPPRKKNGKAPGSGFEQVFEKVYKLVLKIPAGRVMTYGQIARLLEDRYSPRLVGWAMHATPQDGREIPWHRVINSRGGVSTGRVIVSQPDLQRLLLEAEGVVFSEAGFCDLRVFQWSPSLGRRRPIPPFKNSTGPRSIKSENAKPAGARGTRTRNGTNS